MTTPPQSGLTHGDRQHPVDGGPPQRHAERVVWAHCGGDQLLGVLNPAAGSGRRIGVLIVVGGRQYRIGSGRFFVEASRRLADVGVPSLRFDVRGMGDSAGGVRLFDGIQVDIRAAIDVFMQEQPELDGVVLWGLCDGASASLLYLGQSRDPRVAGLLLLNPWVRSPHTLARARLRHHYPKRMRDPHFWSRVFSGDVRWRSLVTWWTDWRDARTAGRSAQSFQSAMAQAWRQADRPIGLVLSGIDDTALEFHETASRLPEWAGTLSLPGVKLQWVPESDHTFSKAAHRQAVIDATTDLIAACEARVRNDLPLRAARP